MLFLKDGRTDSQNILTCKLYFPVSPEISEYIHFKLLASINSALVPGHYSRQGDQVPENFMCSPEAQKIPKPGMFSNINQIFLFIGTFTYVDKYMHQKGANVVRKWGEGWRARGAGGLCQVSELKLEFRCSPELGILPDWVKCDITVKWYMHDMYFKQFFYIKSLEKAIEYILKQPTMTTKAVFVTNYTYRNKNRR